MRRMLITLAGGLLLGAVAASYAELPPPTPEEKAAAAAKAQKAEADKAKAAREVSRAQDKAVGNYRKNKGSSSTGATVQPEAQPPAAAQAPAQSGQSQGADHSKAGMPDAELTPHEAQSEMPKPGQVNDYSTPARDPQNSSPSR
jgi:hypothetical protein